MRRVMMILTIVATMGTLSGAVHASSFDSSCVITTLGFSNDTWGRTLWFQCSSGALYYDFLSGGGTGCGADSVDNVKLYEAVATAAKLSGKVAQVTYNTPANCSSRKIFNSITIMP